MLRRLDKAFQAFFRRVKAGETPGYPRFKSYGRYDSITFPAYDDGCKIRGKKLYTQNIGEIKMKMHRPIEGRIKTVTIKRKAGKWFVAFACEVEAKPLPSSDEAIGIDLGLTHLIATSDGEFIDPPKFLRKAEKRLKQKQREISRKRRGSNRRRKAAAELGRLHEHVANQRKDFAHKLSRKLVNSFGLIVFEDLNTHGMVQNHHLAKAICDASWNRLVQFTASKAEEAGRRVVLVNPKNTSQMCSNCGQLVLKELRERTHRCPHCGYTADRDTNAARNILIKGRELLQAA